MSSSAFTDSGIIYEVYSENETVKFVNDANTCTILYKEIQNDEIEDFLTLENLHTQDVFEISITNPFTSKKHYEHHFKFLLTYLLSKITKCPTKISIFFFDDDDYELLRCFIGFLNFSFKCDMKLEREDKLRIFWNKEIIYEVTI